LKLLFAATADFAIASRIPAAKDDAFAATFAEMQAATFASCNPVALRAAKLAMHAALADALAASFRDDSGCFGNLLDFGGAANVDPRMSSS
jgi:hypothetical protein